MADGDRSLAVFVDFENLALGFQGRRERFDISRVLERLVEKGKIVVKKAYADWNRFAFFTQALHEAAIELIEIPRRAVTGKNSADIRLVVDAMDLAYSKDHINTFVIVSGDSDFSPLVSKLKELGKHVIGLGMQESTSDLLRDNCDEFIYYEDLGREPTLEPGLANDLPELKKKAFALLMDALHALRRENKDVLWSSMIKDTIKRKKPSFNEAYHHYRTFSELLEDAAREGLLSLEIDKRSRTYVVTRFGPEMQAEPPPAAVPTPDTETPAPTKVEPPRPTVGITVDPNLFASAQGVETPRIAGVPVVAGSLEGAPPRKKSRRRRRRGGGGGGGGIPNGQPAPVVAAPAAVAAVPPPIPVVVAVTPPELLVEPPIAATPVAMAIVTPPAPPIDAVPPQTVGGAFDEGLFDEPIQTPTVVVLEPPAPVSKIEEESKTAPEKPKRKRTTPTTGKKPVTPRKRKAASED